MELLQCPQCRARSLDLAVVSEQDGEIRDGRLDCNACGASYRIRDFVPRFVGADSYTESFSREWTWFSDVQVDAVNRNRESEDDFRWITGWQPSDISGARVLDVGVGAGRYADVASAWGAEVVGVDLSFAVDAAFHNVGRRPNVHLVQADLFHLPFAPGVFDRVYSLGVLHHTPDTRAAFRAVVPLLRDGGWLAVFLYAHGHYHYLSDFWRKVTTRLPRRLVYYLATVAVPLYWVHKIPVLGKAIQFALPTANWPNWRWRWLDTFDWYTPTFQWKHTWPEVYSWFHEEGFREIQLRQETPDTSLQMICMSGRRLPSERRKPEAECRS